MSEQKKEWKLDPKIKDIIIENLIRTAALIIGHILLQLIESKLF
jgi:hypothetical protein